MGIGLGGSGVHGRDRELRSIRSFAFDLDPTTLVVSGLSGAGKTTTVLTALERAGLGEQVVRIVRSISPRPHAQLSAKGPRLDLSGLVAAKGGRIALDPDGLFEALGPGAASGGPRILFVDDVEVLTADRVAWLRRLTETAYDNGWRVIAAAWLLPDHPQPSGMDVVALGPLSSVSLRQVLQEELHQPIAEDVAERLRRWSGGVPQVALELAAGLSPEQLRGSTGWAGPVSVGPAARRAYRVLLDGLTDADTRDLARATPRSGAPARSTDELGAQHPLLALLCQDEYGADQAAGVDDGLGPADLFAAALDGLHLEDLAGATSAGITPRITAGVVAVALLTGTSLVAGRTGERLLRHMSPEWTDHLWWHTAPSDQAIRAAGARVTATLVVLEGCGQLLDPAGFRSDLDLLDQVPDAHWVGVCIRVRGRLLLGDVAGARSLLDASTGLRHEPTIAEIVARDLAESSIGITEGRPAGARTYLEHATRLRPGIRNWLPVAGHEALVAAMLDGQAPVVGALRSPSPWSERAVGEYTLDLGAAHLVVGQAAQASELLTSGLERCAWPYRGRAQARADAVEAVMVSDGKLRPRSRRLVRPPLAAEEQLHVTAAASAKRAKTFLTKDRNTTSLDDWLPVGHTPLTPWLRLRALIAFGHHGLGHGDDWTLQHMAREARILADLAGTPGWCGAIDAVLDTERSVRPGWDLLSENERTLLRLVVQGATNEQIAEAVYLSKRSVANRFRQIYTRLRVRDRRELIELMVAEPPDWIGESGS
ncbi:LuxR C-terminal-related transcriptional regulator [Promicromonospora sp. NPDC057488]|uniref:helix-turn-helix transcriptional regulator n=1 Tax=Promicromonospora sp. NPDC057488 TaxID=3346147 RepID=UPI00366F13B9